MTSTIRRRGQSIPAHLACHSWRRSASGRADGGRRGGPAWVLRKHKHLDALLIKTSAAVRPLGPAPTAKASMHISTIRTGPKSSICPKDSLVNELARRLRSRRHHLAPDPASLLGRCFHCSPIGVTHAFSYGQKVNSNQCRTLLFDKKYRVFANPWDCTSASNWGQSTNGSELHGAPSQMRTTKRMPLKRQSKLNFGGSTSR